MRQVLVRTAELGRDHTGAKARLVREVAMKDVERHLNLWLPEERKQRGDRVAQSPVHV